MIMLSLIYDARKISGILPFCTNPAPVEHTECRAVIFYLAVLKSLINFASRIQSAQTYK